MVTRPVSKPPVIPAVDLLILGAGWTSTFLIPLLTSEKVSYAATTTTGRDDTIPFEFDPDSDDLDPYRTLPDARTVLITFPLKGVGQSSTIVKCYEASRESQHVDQRPRTESTDQRLYIQLGSTGIFTAPHWNTSKSSVDLQNSRCIAENELLALGSAPNLVTTSHGEAITSTVLNLSGLWGGERQPRYWLPRVIKKRSDVEGKKALHLVHGEDVAQAVLGAHLKPEKVRGQRWIVTDLHVYDWWDLIVQWATEEAKGTSTMAKVRETGTSLRDFGVVDGPGLTPTGGVLTTSQIDLQAEVFKCLEKSGVRALPRDPNSLGRVLDGRELWKVIGRHPTVGRVT